MKYTYTGVINQDPNDGLYLVYFPDFDRMTQGEDWEDAFAMGEDLLASLLVDMEDNQEQPPVPATLDAIAEKGLPAVFRVDTLKFRRENGEHSSKKN